MQTMRQRLPQLDPLIAFEAAARHGSFKLAAQELCITPSAISQQIRGLECQLNVALFERGHRSVHLTEQGREFRNSIVVALNHLANAAEQVCAKDSIERLEVSSDLSFATHWLMPRLPEFEARHPEICLQIRVSELRDELLSENVQVALVHGRGNWRGFVTEQMFEEEVFPVCAPGYLASRNGAFDLNDLAQVELLDLDYENWNWMNWAIWLTEAKLALPDQPRKFRTNSYPMLIDAAKRGAGMALAWRYLVDDDLASGTLIRPVELTIKTQYGYHVAYPYNTKITRAANCFLMWLNECRDRQRQAMHPSF